MITNNFNKETHYHFILNWLNKLLKQGSLDDQSPFDGDTAEASGDDEPDEQEANGDETEIEESDADSEIAQDDTDGPVDDADSSPDIMTAFLAALGIKPAAAAITPIRTAAARTTEIPAGGQSPILLAQNHTATTPIPGAGTDLHLPHTTAVFWGDSIAYGMASSIQPGTFNKVVNLGTPGAGFLTSTKPQPVTNLPANAAAFIYFGTNDVASLMGQSDAQIAAYAKRVIDVAQQMKTQGAEPVILGLNAPKGAYTGGSDIWKQPGFVEKWTATMERLNQEYQSQAQAAGITYAATDAQITNSHISADNLHLTTEGNRTMANIGVQALKN